MQEFISEDDLKTFDGWLKYQGVDPETTKPDDLETWRGLYEEGRKRTLAMRKVGLMKIQRVPGEHLYAVAVREGSDLWLTMWVRHSQKGEFFAMLPRQDRQWDVHASYHLDGNLHIKSDGGKLVSKCQPLTSNFQGTQPLSSRLRDMVQKASGRFAIQPHSLVLWKFRPVSWDHATAR